MISLSSWLNIDVILSFLRSGWICSVSNEELIISVIISAVEYMVLLPTSGSIPSGPSARVYLAFVAISTTSCGVVGRRAKQLRVGDYDENSYFVDVSV